ncbi:phage mu protein f like protein [Lactobacillus selangorensis]|uniref:Phage mu protein f like protein n=1 Tax=Lactobacillus selangorensis TaxID=81857 RepID=A0A0R2FVE9_9LACO|nr:minor capsid protein [Lactobacillus selangorensis]KRN29226.1 phage mu protein f like protein [Lactobacillus selangorensis]KRN31416.1 phage mu protein f like protein [Lactobacillus selangorensis]
MPDDYWKKREEAWIAQNIKSDAEFDQQINEHYRAAMKGIEDDINRYYANYAGREGISIAEARKRVASADVKGFSKRAAQMVKDKDFSDEANERLKLYNATMRINRAEQLKARIGLSLTDMTSSEQKAFKDKFNRSYKAEIKRQAGILGENQVGVSNDRMAEVVNGSFNGARWSDRLWANQDELKGLLDNILTQDMIQGQGIQELTRKIQKAMDARKFVAERLARTETARIQDQAQMDSFKKYGYKQVHWIAEPSACKTCRNIAEDNEGIYDLEDVPLIPVHPNCRCTKAAYMDRDKVMKDIDEKLGSEDPRESIDDSGSDGLQKMFDRLDLSKASPADMMKLGKMFDDKYGISKRIGDKDYISGAISKFRPVGGHIPNENWWKRSNKAIKSQIQDAFSYYPKQWSDYVVDNGKKFFAGKTKRGFFSGALCDSSGRYYLRGAQEGQGISIYANGVRKTTAFHELGHLVEYFNPNLVRINKDFVASRTKGEKPSRLRDIFIGYGYSPEEVTKKDDFISPYIGKEYRNATEVLSVGLESVFQPEWGQVKRDTGYKREMAMITDDPDYLHLILAILLKG